MKGGAVVCHPHPLYGGDMEHPVVVALAAALAGEGFLSLRFNFRGAGRSQGSHDGGAGEREDLVAGLNHVEDEVGTGAPLVLAGYSFGAWVAYPVATADPRVAAVLCVAPPLELLPMPPVGRSDVARWFAQGDRDEFCPRRTFNEWYRTQDGPKEKLELAGVDHFMVSREKDVAAAAVAFATRHLNGRHP